jgi:glycosyltransferase involved in cell wall biosynthesis
LPLFSFLIPTRNRISEVNRFLQSVVDTTHRLREIEVVFCVDEDDLGSHNIRFEPLSIKTVIAPQGANMGELNRRCFDASSGRFVMLMNDDVIVRSKNWDREIYSAFASFGDDVGLVHTNDLLFQEKLCTFPILSRKACLEIGVCRPEYRRYRIDDHIYDTYNLLAYLGHRRIVYLPDVIFEHLNHQMTCDETAEKFESETGKFYVPNQETLEFDATVFDSLIESRKEDALKLAGLINRLQHEKKNREFTERLKQINGALSYRQPDFVRVTPLSSVPDPGKNASVTVAVVTSDIYKPHAQKCLSLLKKHTSRFDLVILDNNGSKDFNHPREMNKALRLAKTDFLVLMDDDVLVEQGWLDGLLKSVDSETAVVSPLHKDRSGKVSHSGVYLMGDEWGTHAHLVDVPNEPRVTQCLCSACLLIDLRKAAAIFFNESYRKYFLDLDYSLQVWEAGYKVVCTPWSVVTHLAGATMPHGSKASTLLLNKDISIFAADWIRSGRLERLKTNMFRRFPFLLLLSQLPAQIQSVLREDSREFTQFQAQVNELVSGSAPYPLFRHLLIQELTECLERSQQRGDELKSKFCETVLVRLDKEPIGYAGPVPVLLELYKGHNLVQYLDSVLVFPVALGRLNLTLRKNRERPGIFTAANVQQARSVIDAMPHEDSVPAEATAISTKYIQSKALLSRFASWLEPLVVNRPFLFRLLVKHPVLFRTAQRFKHTLTGGGVA